MFKTESVCPQRHKGAGPAICWQSKYFAFHIFEIVWKRPSTSKRAHVHLDKSSLLLPITKGKRKILHHFHHQCGDCFITSPTDNKCQGKYLLCQRSVRLLDCNLAMFWTCFLSPFRTEWRNLTTRCTQGGHSFYPTSLWLSHSPSHSLVALFLSLLTR